MDSEPCYHKSLRRSEDDDAVTKCKVQLQSDILALIADRLGIIELFRFRCVCKDWYSASSSSSAQVECSPFRQPWFLLYGETSQCILLTASAKKYTVNLPELDAGATCIASNKGWLLVLRNDSIYFFCPFSGAKLDLPNLPIKEFSNCLGAFSSPPTSPGCTVCFFTQNRSSDSNELYVLIRGATSWTKHVLNSMKRTGFKTIRSATFHGDEVHLMDEIDGLITFNLKKKGVEVFQIVTRRSDCPNAETMPFYLRRDYFLSKKMVKVLGLGGDVSLTTCGTRVVQQPNKDEVIFGETITVVPDEEHSMTRLLKGVWMHPRFFQVSPSYRW